MDVTGIKLAIGKSGNVFPFTFAKSVTIPIFGAQPNDPYILKGADGLGPPEVDVFRSGGTLHRLRAKDRQLVFRVGINPQYSGTIQTVSSLRESLYSYVSYQSEPLTIYIMGPAGELIYTSGYISKFETVPFTKEPMVQMTIDCVEPYFRGPEDVWDLTTTPSRTHVVNNPGNAPSPFYLIAQVVSTATQTSIENQTFGGRFSFPTNSALVSGDILTLNTNPGVRSVLRFRSSMSTPLTANLYQAQIEWLTLQPGSNTLYVSENLTITGLIYSPLYQGV